MFAITQQKRRTKYDSQCRYRMQWSIKLNRQWVVRCVSFNFKIASWAGWVRKKAFIDFIAIKSGQCHSIIDTLEHASIYEYIYCNEKKIILYTNIEHVHACVYVRSISNVIFQNAISATYIHTIQHGIVPALNFHMGDMHTKRNIASWNQLQNCNSFPIPTRNSNNNNKKWH